MVLLDLGLEDMDGLDGPATAARSLRHAGAGGHGSRRRALHGRGTAPGGADDYLVKPVRLHELLARLTAVTRRYPGFASPPERLQLGDLVIEVAAHRVTYGETEVSLTPPTEFSLLLGFAKHVAVR